MLAGVVPADGGRSQGGRSGELQPVLAAVPVGGGDCNIQTEDHEVQTEEADVGVKLVEPVETGGGLVVGRGISRVLEVGGVLGDVPPTPGLADDAAGSKSRGARSVRQSSSLGGTF